MVKYFEFNPNLEFKNTSSKIYDRNKILLSEISENNSVKRTPIKIQQVPSFCLDAITSAEDKSFWYNIGVDIKGLGRLFLTFLTGRNFGGGSTISQQLIKNSNDRVLKRDPSDKLTEIIQSIKLNSVLSKEEILELYLNNIYFGNLNYGLESAALDYFDKTTSELNELECAYLMGIPQSPGIYNPYANPELGKKRMQRVLKEMLEDGKVSEEQFNTLISQDLHFRLKKAEVRAPHFVDFVKNYLISKDRGNVFNDKKIYTKYNYELHRKVLEVLDKYFKKQLSINNASVIILNSQGEIETMIGSRNYFDNQINGKFNAVFGLRQPSLLYLTIIEKFVNDQKVDVTKKFNNREFEYLRSISIDGRLVQTVGIAKKKEQNSTDPMSLSEALTKHEPIPVTHFLKSGAFNKFMDWIFTKEIDKNVSKRCDVYLLFEGCEMSLFDLSKIFFFILSEKDIDEGVMIFGSNSYEISLQQIKVYSVDINSKDTFSIASNKKYLVCVWSGNTDGSTFNKSNVNYAHEISEEILKVL